MQSLGALKASFKELGENTVVVPSAAFTAAGAAGGGEPVRTRIVLY